jgi:hypothetical protein
MSTTTTASNNTLRNNMGHRNVSWSSDERESYAKPWMQVESLAGGNNNLFANVSGTNELVFSLFVQINRGNPNGRTAASANTDFGKEQLFRI